MLAVRSTSVVRPATARAAARVPLRVNKVRAQQIKKDVLHEIEGADGVALAPIVAGRGAQKHF